MFKNGAKITNTMIQESIGPVSFERTVGTNVSVSELEEGTTWSGMG